MQLWFYLFFPPLFHFTWCTMELYFWATPAKTCATISNAVGTMWALTNSTFVGTSNLPSLHVSSTTSRITDGINSLPSCSVIRRPWRRKERDGDLSNIWISLSVSSYYGKRLIWRKKMYLTSHIIPSLFSAGNIFTISLPKIFPNFFFVIPKFSPSI